MPATTTVPNLAKVVYPYGISLLTGLKCALFLSTSNIATVAVSAAHSLYADLTNEVASGAGYTTAGKALTTVAWSGTTSPILTSDPLIWTGATFTFRFAVIYDVASGKIVRYTDFATDQSVVAGTLTLTPDTNGLFMITSS